MSKRLKIQWRNFIRSKLCHVPVYGGEISLRRAWSESRDPL